MELDEAVQSFVAITGADVDVARRTLEATGHDLEGAVNLFFASNADDGPPPLLPLGGDASGGGGGGAAPYAGGIEGDEALAQQLQGQGDAGAGGMGEQEVRAPIPVRTERLYGEEVAPRPMRTRRVNPVPETVVDAFRDFRSESAAGAGVASGSSGAGGSGSLATMYEPPRDLLFQGGGFEEAKQAAAGQGRWLLVNLQSTTQFASHQLNRDTWRDPMVRSLVENNFVLYQVFADVVEEGQKLLSFYHVLELPATLVIDPVTGAPMRLWTGFIQPDRLTEDLMPFLDHSIHDPAASRLAASMKRKQHQQLMQHSGGGGGGSGQSSDVDEDAELQRAIQASMGQSGAGTGGSGAGLSGAGPSAAAAAVEREPKDGTPEPETASPAAEPAAAARPAEEVAAEAAARLPEEPEGKEGFRIGVRFPNGSRAQRRFPASAPLSTLRDFCLAHCAEAAAGRPFSMAQGFPGAPELSELEVTLEAAGLRGSMLSMRWAD